MYPPHALFTKEFEWSFHTQIKNDPAMDKFTIKEATMAVRKNCALEDRIIAHGAEYCISEKCVVCCEGKWKERRKLKKT
jgi:hypothetical protein